MMNNKMIGYDLSELKEQSGAECAQLLYDIAVRGKEIEQQVTDFLASEYSLTSCCHQGEWWIADRREDHYGKSLHNPATQSGGFPNLSILLKWCVKNRT